MSRTFRFPAIDRVVHGPGAVAEVPDIVGELRAERVMIVTGRSLATETDQIATLERALGDRHVATFPRMRAHAPRVDVDDAIALVGECDADLLIGYGGSSVTDATKIVRGTCSWRTTPSRPCAYHLVVGGVDARLGHDR